MEFGALFGFLAQVIAAMVMVFAFPNTSAAEQSSVAEMIEQCRPEVESAVESVRSDLIPYKALFKSVIDKLDASEKAELRQHSKSIDEARAHYDRTVNALNAKFAELAREGIGISEVGNDPEYSRIDQVYKAAADAWSRAFRRQQDAARAIFGDNDSRWNEFRRTREQAREIAQKGGLLLNIPPLADSQFYRYSSLRIWSHGGKFSHSVDLTLLSDSIRIGPEVGNRLSGECRFHYDYNRAFEAFVDGQLNPVLRLD